MLMAIYLVVVNEYTFLINVHFTIIFAGLLGCKIKTMSNAELHSIITLLFYLNYSYSHTITVCTWHMWCNYHRLKIASEGLVTAS